MSLIRTYQILEMMKAAIPSITKMIPSISDINPEIARYMPQKMETAIEAIPAKSMALLSRAIFLTIGTDPMGEPAFTSLRLPTYGTYRIRIRKNQAVKKPPINWTLRG